MPQRIAKVAQDYAGVRIEVGQEFTVEPAHVAILSAMGAIEREDSDPVFRAGILEPASPAAPNKSAYKTRELRASKSASVA